MKMKCVQTLVPIPEYLNDASNANWSKPQSGLNPIETNNLLTED